MILTLALVITGATVTDGDTLRQGGTRYRIWGIDAPERDEPGFAAATAAMEALIAGRALACEDLGPDRYGRTVVRCLLPDGRDLACTMIATGTAEDYPRYSRGAYAECGE